MKIEKFPGFLCTIDERRILTTMAIPWDNCEYVPALAREYSSQVNYPFPVKFVPRPKDKNNGGFYPHPTVAVRTDVYPLLWIYVWAYLQVEVHIYNAFGWLMWHCNRLGIARTEPGRVPSIRDFKVDKFLVIQLLINFVFTSIFVILLKAGQPILCVFCFLLNWFLQYLVSKKRNNRRAMLKYFSNMEKAALARLQAENTLIPIFPKNTLELPDCLRCKYFYGKQSIVCAVHPTGYDGDSCGDRCDG